MSFMWGVREAIDRLHPVQEDQTERSLHSIIACVGDFDRAVESAHSVSRCLQLVERIDAAITLLDEAKYAALDKAHRL